jgi:hypothetical protein
MKKQLKNIFNQLAYNLDEINKNKPGMQIKNQD